MYKESSTDKQLHKKFLNDEAQNYLRSVELKEGKLRALNPFKIDFQYPISLIAGTNGCGKSTLLAIVACGFHNFSKQVTVTANKKKKKQSYYTFGDFLVQSKQELPPSGIEIIYEVAQEDISNKASSTKLSLKKHVLKKLTGGKWANYQKRTIKNVEYFAIERVVPHYEKSVSKSYRAAFKASERTEADAKTEKSVGKILGKTYTNFSLQKHAEHTLPVVNRNDCSYSGFNMGAGENALFNIFFTLHSCPPASLIVIDEIELGLHAQAQINFINELKELCEKKNLQVIATTHSPIALTAVPPYARFFIDSSSDNTKVETYITPEYASGKFIGKNSEELIVFVEDDVAKQIIHSALIFTLKERVVIKAIGSDILVVKCLATTKITEPNKKAIAYIDGDGVTRKGAHFSAAKSVFERVNDTEIQKFCDSNIFYLGANSAPEKWLITSIKNDALDEFMLEFDIDIRSKAIEMLDLALLQNTHYELNNLANSLHIDKDDLTKRLARALFRTNKDLKAEINKNVQNALEIN